MSTEVSSRETAGEATTTSTLEVARKRSWESEDEELKENTEVGKVVFDNKEVEDDEEVDQGGDL